jgi:hypothetical protein
MVAVTVAVTAAGALAVAGNGSTSAARGLVTAGNSNGGSGFSLSTGTGKTPRPLIRRTSPPVFCISSYIFCWIRLPIICIRRDLRCSGSCFEFKWAATCGPFGTACYWLLWLWFALLPQFLHRNHRAPSLPRGTGLHSLGPRRPLDALEPTSYGPTTSAGGWMLHQRIGTSFALLAAAGAQHQLQAVWQLSHHQQSHWQVSSSAKAQPDSNWHMLHIISGTAAAGKQRCCSQIH